MTVATAFDISQLPAASGGMDATKPRIRGRALTEVSLLTDCVATMFRLSFLTFTLSGLLALGTGCTPEEGPGIGPPGGHDAGPPRDTQHRPDQQIASPGTIARRMSRFLWNQVEPDSALCASLGAAPTPEKVAQVAASMLNDARSRDGFGTFIQWWLRLRDLQTYKQTEAELTPELRKSMTDQASALAIDVVFDGDARLETLLLTPTVFLNEVLARHYGVGNVPGQEMRRVPIENSGRVGILSGSGVMTRFSSTLRVTWPARRFWLASETLFCGTDGLPPPPPPGLDISVTIDPGKPIRSQMEAATPGDCQTCHAFANNAGFAFMKFDGLGRLQASDPGGAIDTSGVLVLDTEPALRFADLRSFLQQVLDRGHAGRCFVQRLLAFALDPIPLAPDRWVSAPITKPGWTDSVPDLEATFVSSKGNIRSLLVAISRSAAFLHPPPEATGPDEGCFSSRP